MRRLCVFCGSKAGTEPRYAESAAELGRLLAARGIGLVFGGGSVGLMGAIADAVLDAGGEAIGVIPRKLATKELLHPRVLDMRVVDSMHARKALMAELADAFVALPGGLGTFEELFEVVTWTQLGFHRKNVGLLNVAGYFDPLVRLIDHAIQEGFIKPAHRGLLVVEERPEALLDRLATHELPPVPRWLGPAET
ncbi:MAG: TIGR00730 family Rossman fold protein [Planctomycetales bacterium]